MAQDPPAQDQMHYEAMAQEALRGVVKAALKRAAAPDGLPGAHHFYITFKSEAPGVSGVRILVERVPQEWPTGDGSLSGSTLTVYDYPERNPTTQPAFPSALPGAEDAAV